MDDYRARKLERTKHYKKHVEGWKQRSCSACNGSGRYDHNGSPKCAGCNGSGRERYKPERKSVMKCHYCANQSNKTVVWLKDKNGRAAEIKLPWCGCDLMTALRRFWPCPYQVIEGIDYRIDELETGWSQTTLSELNQMVRDGKKLPPYVVEFIEQLLEKNK